MTDPESVLQNAIERLLEDESLTADLIDDAAKILLDWGITQTKAIVKQAADDSSNDLTERLADLRHTLKRIGKKAGDFEPEAQAEMTKQLLLQIEPQEDLEVETCTPDHIDQPLCS
jgi:hypothetical protein